MVLRFSGLNWPSRWMSLKSRLHSLMTSACFPAARLMPMASWMTMAANVIAMAKYTVPTPSVRAMLVVRAITPAVWLEGIPPVLCKRLQSNSRSKIALMNGLSNCAIKKEEAAAINGAFWRMSLFIVQMYPLFVLYAIMLLALGGLNLLYIALYRRL